MHPLSTFPSLLYLGLISPLLLRIAIGFFILFLAKERFSKSTKFLSVFHVIFGVLIIIGLYTQISAIVAFFLIVTEYILDKKTSAPSKEKTALYTIVLVILLSLLFTGPGLFAFDLPL